MHTEYALIGHPLGHSYSSRLFNARFESEGIEASYINLDMPDLKVLPALLHEHPQLRGFNVTIPHKQGILPYLDSLTPAAEKAGAVNAVRVERLEARILLHGDNTDIPGFRESLRPLLPSGRTGLRALILGTGGASKAVRTALDELGIGFTVVSRRAGTGLTYAGIDESIIASHRLIINATPLGTFPDTDTLPPLPYDAITPAHILFDLVYNPPLTAFLREGLKRGALCRNGLEMLRLQARAAWEFWQATRNQ